MVFDDGQVENRLMRRPAGVTPSALAGGVELPQRPAARPHPGRGRASRCAASWSAPAASSTRPRARLVEEGLAAWGGGEGATAPLIVRGRANLLGDPETLADLERVRMLFDDLEQKEQLIGLLD